MNDAMGTVRPLDVMGYIAAPVLPMRDDGAIDLDTIDTYVRWIAEDGPKAIVVNSSAGEGELLYPEERAQVLERVVRAVGSRLPVVAGIISEFTADAVAQARSARRAGRPASWSSRREPSAEKGCRPGRRSTITRRSSRRAGSR